MSNIKTGTATQQCVQCGVELSYGRELSAPYDNGARYPRATHTSDRCDAATKTQNDWAQRDLVRGAAQYNTAVMQRYAKFLLLNNMSETVFAINGPVAIADQTQMKKTYVPAWFVNRSHN